MISMHRCEQRRLHTFQEWRSSSYARTSPIDIFPGGRTSEGQLIWGDPDNVPILLVQILNDIV
jgi:hypothetical protein